MPTIQNIRNKNSKDAAFYSKNYEKYLTDKLSLIMAAKTGIDSNAISLILKYYSFKKDFLADILNLSTKTLDRYIRENRKLNPNDSELIIKLILLYNKGVEIFGKQTFFTQWLDKPSFGLENLRPLELINSSGGIDLIIEELTRIEFGDIS